MKTLYLECNMGAAGDMLMAALLELHDGPDVFLKRLNTIGIPGVSVSASSSVKYGITGTHISVLVNGQEEITEDVHEHYHQTGPVHDRHHRQHGGGHHSHNSMHDIEHLISHLRVSDRVKQDAAAVYRLIAEAESHAHGVPVAEIHFHEVGNLDAVADIVGVCMLMEELAPEQVLASPVHVGSGQVKCAHGILPAPAPATAYILQNVPVYGGRVRGELCTPTGAALLKHFAASFGDMPVMKLQKTGYGMGKKDFESANCVRAFLGETGNSEEEVTELICNIDDMTPEAIAFAQQLLFDEGALDVYTTPIGMKKGRTGILFTCMCKSGQTEKFISLIFKHTTTLGMRETVSRRHTLSREHQTIQTQYGPVRMKASSGYGVTKTKPEYEDIAKIAREKGMALSDVIAGIQSKD